MKTYNYTINDIESMSEANLADMADAVETIKGHAVYFVDFGGPFGFSACVCAEGQHIYYANDYELHHRGKSRDELREIYRWKLTGTLFTESELATVSSYVDKSVKEYFLRNLYAMRRPHVSMFCRGAAPDTSGMIFSPVFMAYYNDADFVELGAELLRTLNNAERNREESFDYWKSAFLYEMFNHEYGINWQADYDVCSCYANCNNVKDYTDTEELFTVCGFNDTQKAAYMAARREYFKKQSEQEA